jgi:ABC-type nitrate/sulfonate/bicarbonate transport system substrate-binding protein
MMMRALIGAAWLALAPLAALAADTPKPLNLIVFGGGLSWPVFVAQDKGLFAKHGLAVSVTETPGSVFQIRGLMEGKFDIAMTPFDNVVAYQEGQGEVALNPAPDLFAFMGGISSTLRLIASPDIKSIADLKGRTLGVDAETTGYALAMYDLLAVNGLPPGSYSLERTGGTTFRVKALSEGKIAATMVSSPQEIIPEQKGFRRLGDVQPMIGAYQALSGVARRSWAAREGDALRAYIRAYVEANDWLADPAHRAEAVAVYLAHVPNSTADVAQTAWDIMLTRNEGFQRKAKFDPAGAAKVLEIRSQYGRPPKSLQDWRRYVDESFYGEAVNN